MAAPLALIWVADERTPYVCQSVPLSGGPGYRCSLGRDLGVGLAGHSASF